MLDFGVTGIDRYITLGSPHAPPPTGVVDQTRGILNYCQDACPGAHHPEVRGVWSCTSPSLHAGMPLSLGLGAACVPSQLTQQYSRHNIGSLVAGVTYMLLYGCRPFAP